MPHTASAKKRLRKSIKRRLHNRAVMRDIKMQRKKVLEAAATGEVNRLAEEIRLAVKKVDKAAARRIIHPNTAARVKSRLARTLGANKAANGS
jgi:small subunit ribosomal protein S20